MGNFFGQKTCRAPKVNWGSNQKNNETEAEFGAIFDQAPVGIVKLDSITGKFLTINKAYCKIVGYSIEELLNTNFQSITHEDDLAEDLANMEKLRNGLIDDFSMEKDTSTNRARLFG